MSSSTRRRKKSGWRRHLTTERVIIGGTILVTVLFFVFIFLDSVTGQPPAIDLGAVDDNSQTFPIQSRDHINPGDTHPPYNSNPPTGGWHYPSPSPTGVFPDGLPDETVVHNLEHGHIWLSYQDADDQEAFDALRDLQAVYPDYVIVTYRPENDTRVAAAAWGQLLTLDEVDSQQLQAFIERYQQRAPENVPG